MISKDTIKKLTTRFQTTELNVAREYCQHLFLSYFYKQKGSEKILFKGGSALKIIYGSPRFSEDLDFSGFEASTSLIEQLIEGALLEIEREGIRVEIKESKITSGGYLSIISFDFLGYDINVQIEISQRRENKVEGVVSLITSDLIPPYTVLYLPEDQLVVEKFEALFRRKAPRDFFDLYFILRSRLLMSEDYRKRRRLKDRILKILETEKIDFKRELKLLLPRSHHAILKDFGTVLKGDVLKWACCQSAKILI
jgi:predicted nucleotidyltransferase component of viral defense system